jgi:protoporphyrinogen oxidase
MTGRVIVVGAGIGGLAAAHALKRAGRSVLLLDAANVPGGTMRTENRDGHLVELGPSGFLANTQATIELVDELGLASKLITADRASKRRRIFRGDKLRSVPFGALGLAGSLGLVRDLFCARPAREETVHEFAVRHFGYNASRYLFNPMVSGIHAGDANRISFSAAFPKIAAFERDLSNGKGISVNDLVNVAHRESGFIGKVGTMEVPNFHNTVQIKHMWLDNSKLRSLGYVQRHDIKETVRELVRYYKQQG